MIPYALHIFSLFSIVLGIVCALWVAADVIRRPPHMTVMAFALGILFQFIRPSYPCAT